MKLHFYFFFLLIFFLSSCSTPSRISNSDIDFVYRERDYFSSATMQVFKHNKDSCSLYVKLSDKDLLFKTDDQRTAVLKISIRIYPSYESKVFSDSVSSLFTVADESDSASSRLYELIFPTPALPWFVAAVELYDLNRNQKQEFFIPVDNSHPQSAVNFMLKDKEGIPLVKRYLTSSGSFFVSFSNSSTENLLVRWYKEEYPLADPPFKTSGLKTFRYKPDSVFTISTSEMVQFSEKGIYHIQSDTSVKPGLTVFRFENDFPEVTSSSQLIEPLRYLTTREEYTKLVNSADRKKAADDFWLELAGNSTRARQLIKNYYQRVERANQFFTSYLEGWKSDRGMIYIVFGPPDNVFRDNDSEVWSYTYRYLKAQQNFTFRKIRNPFSENDYALMRFPAYEIPWYMAVDSWRQGRVNE